MQSTTLILAASSFARRAHDGQKRPNRAQLPLWTHVEEVAVLVADSGGSEEEIVAAYLHDTVEDTDATIGEIAERFGRSIAEIVDGLTDPLDFKGLSTHERKCRQAVRVRDECVRVKRVKVADQTSNMRAIAIDPPVKWTKQKCIDYILGARLVANECRGVSPFLDEAFDAAYVQALRAHS